MKKIILKTNINPLVDEDPSENYDYWINPDHEGVQLKIPKPKNPLKISS